MAKPETGSLMHAMSKPFPIDAHLLAVLNSVEDRNYSLPKTVSNLSRKCDNTLAEPDSVYDCAAVDSLLNQEN